MKKGRLIVISGPSGSGKTTIRDRLLRLLPELECSVSYTTRPPRHGEKDGRDYFFISKEEFQKRIKDGGFLEHAKVFDNYYGTCKNRVGDGLKAGKNILLCIDVQGAAQIKKNSDNVVFIFLIPPSIKVLEDRLRKRATDHPEEITKRLAKAKEEMAQVGDYDYVVLNDKVTEAVDEIVGIIKHER